MREGGFFFFSCFIEATDAQCKLPNKLFIHPESNLLFNEMEVYEIIFDERCTVCFRFFFDFLLKIYLKRQIHYINSRCGGIKNKMVDLLCIFIRNGRIQVDSNFLLNLYFDH